MLWSAPLLACASPDAGRVPLCGSHASLAPLPAAQSCDARELAEFSAGLEKRLGERASRALVRVEFDGAAAVRSVCVEDAPGYGRDGARRAVAENLDALLASPPGPTTVLRKSCESYWLDTHEVSINDDSTTSAASVIVGGCVSARTTGGAIGRS